MFVTHKAIISPCRCASTTLENCFAQDETLRVIHQPIKYGILRRGYEDYRVFLRKPLDAKAIVFKETIGSRRIQTAKLVIFPSKELILTTDQVFLFREPLETWRSWLKCGYDKFDLFLISYKHTFEILKNSLEFTPERVSCLTQDTFVEYPEKVLKKLCDRWQIPYIDKMLHWERVFGSDSCLIEFRKNTQVGIKKGIFDNLISANTVIKIKPKQQIPPVNEQEAEVVKQLDSIYRTVSELSQSMFD